MNETVKIWIDDLGNPTPEKIAIEIEEVKSAIKNERIWALGTPENNDHENNIELLEEYLSVLKDMLHEGNNGSLSIDHDYSPSAPWNAPGMTAKDFIR